MDEARILVVEDEAIIAKDIESTLRGLGYAVVGLASSGEEAIQKAMKEKPDLVLMDIVLKSSMDGVQTAEQIHRQLHTPVVFLTAYVDENTLNRAKITEPFGYLVKPFQERELRSTIEIALYKHRMEMRLKENERRFVTMLRSISDAVIATDRERSITFINPMAEALTGWREQEALKRPLGEIFRLMHDGRREAEENPIIQTALEGAAACMANERILVSRQGEEVWIEHSAAPLRDAQGNINGVILTFHDISGRRALETQLLQSQKLEAIGQLAAGIAHEINTPIQYVGDNTRFFEDAFGHLYRLLETYARLLEAASGAGIDGRAVEDVKVMLAEIDLPYLAEEVPKALGQTMEGVERISKIVRAMKEFSHPGTLEKTPVDINRAIETTITVARNEWKYVAEMATDFDPSLPMVPCLPGEFNQVILNLIINAAHTIADVIGDGSAGKGIIRVTTRQDGHWAEIRVSDTGKGIPENIRPKIFNPFFTTKKVGKGTGQGLAIAHSVIVGKHAGTLTFDTELGKGTTFFVRLPIDNGTA